MNNLREELNESLNVFDAFGIPEEQQRLIVLDGVYFWYSPGTTQFDLDRHFNCFKFARFLKFCSETGVQINFEQFFKEKNNRKYMELVHSFDKFDKLSQVQLNGRKR